jgi:uncharacterized protein
LQRKSYPFRMAQADLPRGIHKKLNDAWKQHPVVVLEGLRAVGKTTLVQELVAPDRFRSLADTATRAQAERDLTGWLESLPDGVVIDEAQLVPGLQLVVKQLVDLRGGRPGQFLLTGSARLRRDELGGSDPLLARSKRLRLHPFTQCERAGQPLDVVAALFNEEPRNWSATKTSDSSLLGRVGDGGVAPIWEVSGSQRSDFVSEFANGLFAPDVYDTERSRAGIVRLFRWLASSSGQMRDRAKFAKAGEISAITVEGYLNALTDVHLIEPVVAFHSEAASRETRKARIFVSDPAFAFAMRVPAPGETVGEQLDGFLSETFVAMELLRLASWSVAPTSLHHWRKNEREEVDLVLEHDDPQGARAALARLASVARRVSRPVPSRVCGARRRPHGVGRRQRPVGDSV